MVPFLKITQQNFIWLLLFNTVSIFFWVTTTKGHNVSQFNDANFFLCSCFPASKCQARQCNQAKTNDSDNRIANAKFVVIVILGCVRCRANRVNGFLHNKNGLGSRRTFRGCIGTRRLGRRRTDRSARGTRRNHCGIFGWDRCEIGLKKTLRDRSTLGSAAGTR